MWAWVETVEPLRALLPDHPDAYAPQLGPPDGPGWQPLRPPAAAGTGAALDVAGWCARAREEDNPRRLWSVAATTVGGALAHAVLGAVTAALVTRRRAWDVRAANLAVHPETGRVAVADRTLLVLPDDPAAGDPHTELVAEEDALLDRVAGAAVATLDPLFDAVRAATRFGLVPLWNGAADAVRSTAVHVPLYAGTDRDRPRELGDALVAALALRGARVGRRPEPDTLRWHERDYAVPVRAACCHYYKTEPQVRRPSDAYCLSCPFLGAADRRERFGAFLDGLGDRAEPEYQGGEPVRADR